MKAPHRMLRWALVLLRTLAVCLTLQMSGGVHFVIDLWVRGEAAAQHFAECPDDESDCPPGCASCHCTHVSPALPVTIETLGETRLLPAYEMAWAPYESRTPPSLAPPCVYRPPRV